MLCQTSFLFKTLSLVVGVAHGLGGSLSRVAVIALAIFLSFRLPYVFGVLCFVTLLVCIISPVYGSLLLGRLEGGINTFFSSLLPSGVPLWIAPFVGLAETISYIVRPLVLLVRPLLNISIGVMGAGFLGMASTSNVTLLALLCFVFMYELFVAAVHWFIVVNILEFSVDH
uniref:ATP synthase F0 subunit 6 n=1 Tax=Ancyrocephalus mogurndae TaxID=307077 RepID=A0A6M3R660_9PLAT|nr:ATP synthase F0 subunit 6 [Ancyrocephalus mogurndae]